MSRIMRRCAVLLLSSGIAASPKAQNAAPALGAMPSPEQLPKIEFVFEERVTLAPPTVLGETALGHRQYIPITGGTVAGPKLQGRVIPGGWDFQLRYAGGCGTLSADYFLEASDGTVIHILNEAFSCGLGGSNGERSFFRPTFEAPKGPHEWLTRGTFVATLEMDPPATPAAGGAPVLGAIRIKFYQVK